MLPCPNFPGEIYRSLKSQEPDLLLAIILSPKQSREAFLTFLALYSELRAIKFKAREPMLAEMRFQWWEDSLQAYADGHKEPRHVLAPLLAKVLQTNVELNACLELVEAFRHNADGESGNLLPMEKLFALWELFVTHRIPEVKSLAAGLAAHPASFA